MSEKPGTLASIRQAMMSWRTASVALLSFSSGLPLGLVWIAIPDWMRSSGVDIRMVGLITLAQAPWTFKMLWSPVMDRYRLPFGGRRRGWALVFQVVLFACMLTARSAFFESRLRDSLARWLAERCAFLCSVEPLHFETPRTSPEM